MKHSGKMLACMMGGLAFFANALAVTPDPADNPYQSIIDRNVFGLKPPPPPPDPAEANKPTVLKITLTGITTILGNKRVLMKTAPPPGKPGEAPKGEQSYILTEGQREGDIEVIEIDDKAGSVKVNNAGSVMTLTFDKDGAKLPATPAPAPLAIPGLPIPGLPAVRQFPQPPGAATPSFQLPTRIPRLPAAGSQTDSTPSYAPPGFLPGNTTLPVSQNNSALSPQVAMPTKSLEEQYINMELLRQAGAPGAALMPPTPLNPKANLQGSESPGTATPGQNPQLPTLNLPQVPGRPALPSGPY